MVFLLAASMLYGQGKGAKVTSKGDPSGRSFDGDVVSPSGDSLRVRRIVELTTDGVMHRDLWSDNAKAQELFEEALGIDSTDVAANYQMGVLFHERDVARAMKYAKMAYDGDTTNKWCLELYAQQLVIGGQLNEAIDLYRKLVKMEPSSPDYYRILAILYQYSNRPHSAIEVLDSADLKIGKNPYLNPLKHSLLLATLQIDRALEEAQEMVANTPSDIQSRINLAEVYVTMKRDSLAEIEFHTALAIDSTSRITLTSLGKYYDERGRMSDYFDIMRLLFKSEECSLMECLRIVQKMTYDKAFHRANYIRVTELISILAIRFPSEKMVVELRANNLITMGLIDEALDLYKRHTNDRPADLDYFKSVIEIESYKERLDSAELYISRAIDLFPDNADLYITKGYTKAYAKDSAGAIEAYKEAIEHAPNDTLASRVWGYIGDVEYQISTELERPSAVKRAMQRCYAAYDKALELYGDNIVVLNNYAYFICEEDGGDLMRALTMSTRAIELEKNNPTHLDTHAWILFKLGQLDEAIKFMRVAISLDKSKSPELPLHYGDILAAQGNLFMAEVYWRKAEELGYPKEEIQRRIDEVKTSEQ